MGGGYTGRLVLKVHFQDTKSLYGMGCESKLKYELYDCMELCEQGLSSVCRDWLCRYVFHWGWPVGNYAFSGVGTNVYMVS